MGGKWKRSCRSTVEDILEANGNAMYATKLRKMTAITYAVCKGAINQTLRDMVKAKVLSRTKCRCEECGIVTWRYEKL